MLDGVAYGITAWSYATDRAQLAARLADFRAGLELPPPASPWARSLAPVTSAHAIGDVTVKLETRPGLLAPVELEGFVAAWHARQQQQRLALMKWSDVVGLDAAANAEYRTLVAWDDSFRVVERSSRTIDGVECGVVLGQTDDFTSKTLLIPAGPGCWAVLRHLAPGEAGEPRPLREAILASVRVATAADDLGLPALAGSDVTADATAPRSRIDAFVASTTPFDRLQLWAAHGQALGAGGFLLVGWDKVVRAERDRHEVLYSRPGGAITAASWSAGRLLVATSDGVVAIRDGEALPAGFEADCLCSLGDDLLLARARQPAIAGLTSEDRVGRAVLVRRRPAGDEVEIADLGRLRVTAMAPSGEGRHVLLFGLAADLRRGGPTPQLIRVGLADGAVTELSAWRFARAIGSAAQGWLVSGRPIDRATGIWHLAVDGAVAPLVTGGGVIGIAADDAELLFARSVGVELELRTVTLARCREVGAGCAPISAAMLDRIGVALTTGGAEPPDSATAIADTVRAMQDFAAALTGLRLPVAAPDLEVLLAELRDPAAPASVPARTVATLLVAHAAIAGGGAHWVSSGAVDWQQWQARAAAASSTPFAYCASPVALVAERLDADEPEAAFAGLRTATAGRHLLLGLDPAALGRRAAELQPIEFDPAVAALDVAALGGVLARAPANTELRRQLYAELAGRDELTAVERLARAQSTVETPLGVDLVAWLAAWHERLEHADPAPDVAAFRELFDAALAAAHRCPRAAGIYWFLGRAAARAFPDRPDRARRCWQRVLEVESWGEWGRAARAALKQ
ncbi:MAG: hypothetical protein KDE27_14930 [Planctomycetes bacterium]|nr:hypothetical protein [Planctomycetota bacterium]